MITLLNRLGLFVDHNGDPLTDIDTVILNTYPPVFEETKNPQIVGKILDISMDVETYIDVAFDIETSTIRDERIIEEEDIINKKMFDLTTPAIIEPSINQQGEIYHSHESTFAKLAHLIGQELYNGDEHHDLDIFISMRSVETVTQRKKHLMKAIQKRVDRLIPTVFGYMLYNELMDRGEGFQLLDDGKIRKDCFVIYHVISGVPYIQVLVDELYDELVKRTDGMSNTEKENYIQMTYNLIDLETTYENITDTTEDIEYIASEEFWESVDSHLLTEDRQSIYIHEQFVLLVMMQLPVMTSRYYFNQIINSVRQLNGRDTLPIETIEDIFDSYIPGYDLASDTSLDIANRITQTIIGLSKL